MRVFVLAGSEQGTSVRSLGELLVLPGLAEAYTNQVAAAYMQHAGYPLSSTDSSQNPKYKP